VARPPSPFEMMPPYRHKLLILFELSACLSLAHRLNSDDITRYRAIDSAISAHWLHYMPLIVL
ncbi:MAG: hypothetical protein ACRDA8_00590, partial [Shewanella sp.]